jgi:hypothetical protein
MAYLDALMDQMDPKAKGPMPAPGGAPPRDMRMSTAQNVTYADGTPSGFKTSVGPPLGLDSAFHAMEEDGKGGGRYINALPGGGASPSPKMRDTLPTMGGVSAGGIQAPVDPLTPIEAPTRAQTYAMRGFDMGKMADPNKQSEKYQIGRVMQQFDPKGGVTPEMLAALNALGIAEFSGQGDKLTVNNTKNDPRFGKGGTADVVFGLKGQNADTAWQPWWIDDGGGEAPQGGGMGQSPMAAMQGIPGLASVLDGSGADQQIAQGVQQYSEPSKYLQALLAQLGGQQ